MTSSNPLRKSTIGGGWASMTCDVGDKYLTPSAHVLMDARPPSRSTGGSFTKGSSCSTLTKNSPRMPASHSSQSSSSIGSRGDRGVGVGHSHSSHTSRTGYGSHSSGGGPPGPPSSQQQQQQRHGPCLPCAVSDAPWDLQTAFGSMISMGGEDRGAGGRRHRGSQPNIGSQAGVRVPQATSTWEGRAPPFGGGRAFESDGRPASRGGGGGYDLEGRPVTRGGTRPPSRMQLGMRYPSLDSAQALPPGGQLTPLNSNTSGLPPQPPGLGLTLRAGHGVGIPAPIGTHGSIGSTAGASVAGKPAESRRPGQSISLDGHLPLSDPASSGIPASHVSKCLSNELSPVDAAGQGASKLAKRSSQGTGLQGYLANTTCPAAGAMTRKSASVVAASAPVVATERGAEDCDVEAFVEGLSDGDPFGVTMDDLDDMANFLNQSHEHEGMQSAIQAASVSVGKRQLMQSNNLQRGSLSCGKEGFGTARQKPTSS